MAQFMCMMLYWHHFRTSGRRIVFNTNPEDTLAKAFLKMLAQCTESEERNADTHLNPLHVRVLDVALILYAEHDLSSSTFAARIAASTLTDFHSAVCVGISTIRVLRECARVWAYTFFFFSLSLSLSQDPEHVDESIQCHNVSRYLQGPLHGGITTQQRRSLKILALQY